MCFGFGRHTQISSRAERRVISSHTNTHKQPMHTTHSRHPTFPRRKTQHTCVCIACAFTHARLSLLCRLLLPLSGAYTYTPNVPAVPSAYTHTQNIHHHRVYLTHPYNQNHHQRHPTITHAVASFVRAMQSQESRLYYAPPEMVSPQ